MNAQDEQRLLDAIRRAPGAEPSAELSAAVRRRAAAAAPQRRPRPVWLQVAAGLIVIAGAATWVRVAEQVPAPLAPRPALQEQATPTPAIPSEPPAAATPMESPTAAHDAIEVAQPMAATSPPPADSGGLAANAPSQDRAGASAAATSAEASAPALAEDKREAAVDSLADDARLLANSKATAAAELDAPAGPSEPPAAQSAEQQPMSEPVFAADPPTVGGNVAAVPPESALPARMPEELPPPPPPAPPAPPVPALSAPVASASPPAPVDEPPATASPPASTAEPLTLSGAADSASAAPRRAQPGAAPLPGAAAKRDAEERSRGEAVDQRFAELRAAIERRDSAAVARLSTDLMRDVPADRWPADLRAMFFPD